MELRHLRYFLAVAEEPHFARAAARVGIEQSPLSSAIRHFESELGLPLFGRTSRRTWLLPAGEILLRHTRQILSAVDEARQSLEAVRLGRTGALQIGLAPGTSTPALRSLLQRFRAAHPDVGITLHACTVTQQLTLLETHALDVAISFEAEHSSEVRSLPLWSESLFAALSLEQARTQDSPLQLKDIVKAGIVVVNAGAYEAQSPIEAALLSQNISLASVHQVADLSALLLWVATGGGIGLISSGQVENLRCDDIVLRPLSTRTPLLKTYLLARKENIAPHAALMLKMVEGEAVSGHLGR